MTKRDQTLGVLAVGLGAIFWGTIGPVIKSFPKGVSLQYSVFRSVFGSLILWIIVALSKKKTRYVREDLIWIILAGIGSGGFLPLFSLGFAHTGVAVASVVAIGFAPIIVGILSWIIFAKKPGREWLVGTTLGIFGITLLNWPRNGASVNLSGFFFSALAAASYSLQAIGMSQLSKRHSPFQVVAPAFSIASLIQAPLSIGKSYEFLSNPIYLMGAIYGAVATLALAYSLFAFGVGRIGPATAVTVGLLEPITAATLGVIVLGESLSLLGVFGIILVLTGLLIVGRSRNEKS